MKVNRFIFYACSRTSQTIQTRVSIIFWWRQFTAGWECPVVDVTNWTQFRAILKQITLLWKSLVQLQLADERVTDTESRNFYIIYYQHSISKWIAVLWNWDYRKSL